MTRSHRQSRLAGFTIVELMVVIAVIAILAAIVIMTYGNYQAKMRDATRKNDVQQIAAALKTYANWNNTYVEVGGGCGSNGGSGNGWVLANAATVPGYAAKSILQCLADIKAIDSNATFIDPSGCDGSTAKCPAAPPIRTYMKATCQKAGVKVTYVMASLETGGESAATIDGLCDTGTISGFSGVYEKWGTRYGMNYYAKVG